MDEEGSIMLEASTLLPPRLCLTAGQDLIEVFPGKPTYDNQQFVRLDPSSSATYLLQSVTKWTRNSRHGMWWTKPRTENKTSPYKGKTLKAIASIDFLNIVRIAIAVQWLKCFEGGGRVSFSIQKLSAVYFWCNFGGTSWIFWKKAPDNFFVSLFIVRSLSL